MKISTLFYFSTIVTAQALRFRDNGLSPNALNHHAIFHRKRAVDPAADPTRASVLSVLATAIPSDALSSLHANGNPTLTAGALPPGWFEKLPADVKTLLPALYPKTGKDGKVEAAGVITSYQPSSSKTACSTTTTTITLTAKPSEPAGTEKTSCSTTTTTTTRTTTLTVQPSPASSSASVSSAASIPSRSCTTTTLTTTMTRTFTVFDSSAWSSISTSTTGSERTPRPGSTSAVNSLATDHPAESTYVSLELPEKGPSVPPFPIGNHTVIGPTSTVMPSQTSASPPVQFTSSASMAMVGLVKMLGVGLAGVVFSIVI